MKIGERERAALAAYSAAFAQQATKYGFWPLVLLSMPIGSSSSLTLLLTRDHLIVQMFTTHLIFSSVALRKKT